MSLRRLSIPVLVLAISACSACGGKGKDTVVPDNRPARRATLSWSTTPAAPNGEVPRVDVFLAVTEETGKSVSYPLGTFDGTCRIIGPIPGYQALTAISCTHEGKGFQLHAAGNPSEVVVLRMAVTEGVEPDPLARDQVTTIPIPLGAKIEAAPQ